MAAGTKHPTWRPLPDHGGSPVAEVALRGIGKVYADGTRAVRELNLAIADGEFLVLVGPSGCGKTTALRMVAGLEDISEGELVIGEQVVNRVPSRDRDVAMVFQSYALYPHLSVRDNIAFGLKLRKTPKAEIRRRVDEAARVLGLHEHLDRKPRNLSGGQRQRVAMGRAIVREPQVFLMDEPLSNLDAKLRVQTRTQIASLQRRLGVTTVYVTHDQVEAMTMGDRVAVLRDGVLQQVAPPRAMYERPANVFVAGFIGSPAMNLEEVPLVPGGAQLGSLVVPLPRHTVAAAGADRVVLGVRPESLEVTGSGDGTAVRVQLVEELGSDALIYGAYETEGDLAGHEVVARVDPRHPPKAGELVHLAVRPGEEHVFSVATGERLPD